MPPEDAAVTRPGRHLAVRPIAFALVVAMLAGVGQPAARAQNGDAQRAGRVRFVTQKRVYLDRGAADGLTGRQTVELFRAGAKAASCQIEILAAHTAVCRGNGSQVGDKFELPRVGRRPPPPTAALRALPPPDDDETVARHARAIADAPHEKVDFVSKTGGGLAPRAWLRGSATLYSEPGSPATYAYETIDADIRHVPIGSTSLRFDAAFTALRRQTTIDPRFRPTVESMFYLWEAEITRRERDARTVFAVGRLWPWHLPGLPMLDGAQIGRRNAAATLEGGAYGGAIPAALTLSPIDGSWAGGILRGGDPGRRGRADAGATGGPGRRPRLHHGGPGARGGGGRAGLVAPSGARGWRPPPPCAARRRASGARARAGGRAVRPDGIDSDPGAGPLPGRRRREPAAAAGRGAEHVGRLSRRRRSVVGMPPRVSGSACWPVAITIGRAPSTRGTPVSSFARPGCSAT